MMKLKQIKPNLTQIDIGRTRTVWFSYETPIGFYDPINQEVIISENVWSRTTGRHLNIIKEMNPYAMVVHNDTFSSMIQDYL